MPEQWLDSLESETRLKAQKMIARMKELGAEEPEPWVESEITEDIAQMARFLILRRLWSDLDAWRSEPSTWIKREIDEAAKTPESPFSEGGHALKRIVDSGVSLEDVGKVAQLIASQTAFDVLNLIDEGADADEEGEDLPGWLLVETNAEGEVTGRAVVGLHEDLFAN